MGGFLPVVITFLTGFLTLAAEMVGGRVLAPYFGSSIYQWAGLIGVALVAYAVGYVAWRLITVRGLAWPFVISGLYLVSLPSWILNLLSKLMPYPIFPATVVGAIAIVGVPSMLWAAILPWALSDSRARSGYILASSTLGSLAGAWGVSFVLIPSFGTRVTVVGLSLLSIVVGCASIRVRSRSSAVGVVAMVALAGAASLVVCRDTRAIIREPWKIQEGQFQDAGEPPPERRLVFLEDSGYQLIAVWDETVQGVTRRHLMLGGLEQFRWNESEPIHRYTDERYSYYNYATALTLLTQHGAAKKALIMGIGGGLIPFQMKHFFPDMRIHAYDIDPKVEQVARSLLPLSKVPEVGVSIGDARQLLQMNVAADGEKWDLILIDTFLNSYVPFHITTREFFQLVYDRAAPGALVISDMHEIFEKTGLLEKVKATVASVFDESYSFPLKTGNTLVFGIKRGTGEPIGATLESRLTQVCDAGEICAFYDKIVNAYKTGQIVNLQHLASRSDLYLTDDHNDTEIRLYETRRQVLVERPF